MIQLKQVSKTYRVGDNRITALRNVSISIKKGEFIAIVGPSGSGKSTLMNFLGCLDLPQQGQILFENMDLATLSDDELARIRNRRIGFVFQNFHLIPRLNALHNVELPMVYGGLERQQRYQRARLALDAVGMAGRENHRPSQLSGGQQQRVAIARAMVNNPDVIIADEPTGSLDVDTSRDIMELFRFMHQSGKTVILVTHEEDVAAYARRRIRIESGRIFSDEGTR